MKKHESTARIIAMAEALHIKIDTKIDTKREEERKNDRKRENETLLPDRS